MKPLSPGGQVAARVLGVIKHPDRMTAEEAEIAVEALFGVAAMVFLRRHGMDASTDDAMSLATMMHNATDLWLSVREKVN
jgi:hypothetical protein